MTITNDVNDFLTESGAPAFKFPNIGDNARGKVVAAVKRQQTDMKTQQPLTWDNGEPRWELVITMDSGTPDENGETNRRLFARGAMLKAIRDALKEAGAQLEVGGELVVKYIADGEVSQRGFNPPKLYKAKYTKPSPAAVDLDDL